MFEDVAEIRTDPKSARVYAEGWQSWSPVGLFRLDGTPPRPTNPVQQTMGFRPGKPLPSEGFQGEGLLAVVGPHGPVELYAAGDPTGEVPSIRVRRESDRVVVSADGPVAGSTFDGSVAAALAGWAETVGQGRLRSIGPGWCSWYCYWEGVREVDVLANVSALQRLELPIEVVQIDDGHQRAVGDWLDRSPRFRPLDFVAHEIRAAGCVPGVWIAPFLVAAHSRLADEHPDWVVEGLDAGFNWNDRLFVLDVGHPDAREHLLDVFRTLAAQGFRYFKLDFLYAGALAGVGRYREGLRIVREGVGDEAFLVGCGAPLLPSIGLVDAMRIGPDIGTSASAIRAAVASVRARAWMHGRLWINDPDCLIVRATVEERELWANQVEACGGVAFSSDPLDELDTRGLELTRRVLRAASTSPID